MFGKRTEIVPSTLEGEVEGFSQVKESPVKGSLGFFSFNTTLTGPQVYSTVQNSNPLPNTLEFFIERVIFFIGIGYPAEYPIIIMNWQLTCNETGIYRYYLNYPFVNQTYISISEPVKYLMEPGSYLNAYLSLDISNCTYTRLGINWCVLGYLRPTSLEPVEGKKLTTASKIGAIIDSCNLRLI